MKITSFSGLAIMPAESMPLLPRDQQHYPPESPPLKFPTVHAATGHFGQVALGARPSATCPGAMRVSYRTAADVHFLVDESLA